jgi:alkylated DNA repair dioxygenase AlkB
MSVKERRHMHVQTHRLQWLKIYAERLHCLGVFPKTPNHVLVNEYTPGQGIMVCLIIHRQKQMGRGHSRPAFARTAHA